MITMKKCLYIGILMIVFIACKKTVDSTNTPSFTTSTASTTSDSAANTFIYGAMKDYYLWADQMPTIASTAIKSKPIDYFYTLLYGYDTIDRFSWMDTSATNLTNQLNGINTVLGIKYSAFYADNTQTNVVFSISYVLKGSAAEAAGLKRGDFIYKVDGKQITLSNYQSILQNQTLGIELANFSNSVFTGTGKTINITKTTLQTNPILKDTVIEWSGKKVGYLTYIQFLTSFDDSLRSIFTRFKNYKNTGIDELVLDLRFNGGGYVTSSDLLTSLIVKDLPSKVGAVMNKKVYNNAYTAVLKKETNPDQYFITNFKAESANLGKLNRVFILTSPGTASASELVINNLKPFMEVILIGEHTYGKNVGSFTITDSKSRWSFGLQPITFKTVNSKDESNYGTVNGFTPDYVVKDNVIPFKPFGDPNETYLGKALSIISPVAFKANALEWSPTIHQNQVNNLPLGDSRILDRKDMWIEHKN
jgi:carboxyl-terminal processing protease